MSTIKTAKRNIERLIKTLESDVMEEYDTESYVDKLQSEVDELEVALDETEYIQESVTMTVKKNVVYILSDLSDEELTVLLENTDLTDAFENQLDS